MVRHGLIFTQQRNTSHLLTMRRTYPEEPTMLNRLHLAVYVLASAVILLDVLVWHP